MIIGARAVALILAALLVSPGVAVAESRLAGLVHEVEPVLRDWGYPAVAGAAALDYVGIPIPADTMLVAATLASTRGDLSFAVVFLTAIAGMIAGSQAGYALGRWGGRALLGRLPLAHERVAQVEARYARWGLWLVWVAPFVDGVRQLNALVAGMLGMPWGRFTAANAGSAVIWAGVWMGGTILVEEHVATALPLLHSGKPWLIAAAIAALVVLLYALRRRAHPSPETKLTQG